MKPDPKGTGSSGLLCTQIRNVLEPVHVKYVCMHTEHVVVGAARTDQRRTQRHWWQANDTSLKLFSHLP